MFLHHQFPIGQKLGYSSTGGQCGNWTCKGLKQKWQALKKSTADEQHLRVMSFGSMTKFSKDQTEDLEDASGILVDPFTVHLLEVVSMEE